MNGSPFCEHKKLRTSCAICKAAAPLPRAALPDYVARHERDDEEDKRGARADARAPVKTSAPKLGGPAKPLMPKKARKQRVTAADEARAEAWWVKKE